MAHKKAAGSTSLGRDSAGKRLGVKLGEGSWAKTGMIIIRQRGTKYHPGLNVKKGKDDTLFSMANGFVKFSNKKMRKFNNTLKDCAIVNVLPEFKGRVKPVTAVLKKKTPMKKPGKTVRVSVKKSKIKIRAAKRIATRAEKKIKPVSK
ncbi:50S ribosomal protein L27 [Candidatus Falkowbacteria bacterium]|nr:50S ribosomal protein L27 [Candidatus Falkowbacteria bacterium]NCT54534.1 50S ribosomal protein L27 [Candidatus Falkowbacteria bacterium]